MKNLSNKHKTTLLYGVLFGYVLSFVFEGRVYFQATKLLSYDTSNQMLMAMFCHMIGLLATGILVKRRRSTKQVMFFTILACIILTPFFLFSNMLVGYLIIAFTSFLSGMAVACWADYYKECVQPEARMTTIANSLIIANLLMILAGLIATYLSIYGSFILISLYLVVALCTLVSFDNEYSCADIYELQKLSHSQIHTLCLFFAFVVVATIDSGLMYGVINLKYEVFSYLTSWFWAIPYIIAILIMKSSYEKKKESYFLYIAFCMIGMGFIFNLLLPFSAISYIVIDIFLLGAAGIIDLFWASKVGESFEYLKNPVRVLSVGWAANVFGVFIGGILSKKVISSKFDDKDLVIMALIVIAISLILLPEMLKRLYLLLESTKCIDSYKEQSEVQKKEFACCIPNYENLTNREKEILQQILLGKTNKDISLELSISENTVKTHVRNILSKYGVTNRAQLINIIWQKEH